MNVESTTVTATKSSKTETSSSAQKKDCEATFKDEFEAVKTQENKKTEEAKKVESEKAQSTQKNAEEASKESAKEKDKPNNNNENAKISNSLAELNSKIAAIKNIKNVSSIHHTEGKADDSLFTKKDYCQTIKMDNNDISFFLNLVENRQMLAQIGQVNNFNPSNTLFTDVKSEATQSTIQVSATLLDAINQSAKTNKPFRIDFDKDIAVIMKVDKEGVLSASFIPGSAAVEAYLKNNIAGLRQNFDNQNLPYNELSYRNNEKQEQQNQSKKKENNDE